MFYWKVLSVVLMSCTSNCHGALEPRCSKFDFEERVLEKLVDLDHTVRTSLKEMDTKIAKLENEIASKLGKYETNLETKLGEYETKLETRVEDYGKVHRNMITQQEKQKSELRANMEQYQANITDIIEDVQSTLKLSLDSLKLKLSDPNTTVAFVAKVVSDDSPSAGSTLLFTTPVVNQGDGYNSSTGIFKAPVAGVYMFSVQLCISINTFINFEIRSSTTVYSMTEHGEKDMDDTCTSVTSVAVLERDEDIWVKCLARDANTGTHGSYTIEGHESPELFWNMFTGALIQEM